jgi:hypothetical protein
MISENGPLSSLTTCINNHVLIVFSGFDASLFRSRLFVVGFLDKGKSIRAHTRTRVLRALLHGHAGVQAATQLTGCDGFVVSQNNESRRGAGRASAGRHPPGELVSTALATKQQAEFLEFHLAGAVEVDCVHHGLNVCEQQ